MPLGFKKFFRRRKPQSALQSNVGSTIRAACPASERKVNVSQNTEASTSSVLHQSETETSRDSFPREESTVEEVTVFKEVSVVEELEEEIPAEKSSSELPAISLKSSNPSKVMASSGDNQDASARRESADTEPSLDEVSPLPSDRRQSQTSATTMGSDFNRDPPDVAASYHSIPHLEQTILPRGGISMDTQAVGRVQVRDYLIVGLLPPFLHT